MKFKNLILSTLIGTLAFSNLGCNKKEGLESKIEQTTSTIKTINGEQYLFEGNKVSQLTIDTDDQAKYGVISDAHGEIEKTRIFTQKFKDMKVNGIILTGDLPRNESLRYGINDRNSDEEEIYQVLETVAQSKLPIFVIPGNHEKKPDYDSALARITSQYANVIDMTKFRVFNGDDVDFISLPGYQTYKIPGRQFIPDNGYWATTSSIQETGKLRAGLDDSVVLITHGAGKTNTDGKLGPATILSGADVGDKTTTDMMKKNDISFATVGHIHEAGGLATTHDGKFVEQGRFATQFTVNFGSLENTRHLDGKDYNGMAGTLTIKGKEAKYEIIYFK